jgi:raffinose/stachyose/melibiose transport system substrate-binding protein
MTSTGREQVRIFAIAAALLASVTVAHAEPVTIDFWSMWNPSEPMAKVTQTSIDEFQQANPDIKVNVNWAGRDVRKLVLPAISAGQKIDLVESGTDLFVRGENYLNWLPLETYLDAPGPNGELSLKSALIQPLLEQYKPDEHTYMVPFQPFAVLYFYNRQQFEQAGITAVPTTWAEFIAAGKALRAAGFDPVTIDEDAYTDVNFGYQALRALGSCDAVVAMLTDKTGEAWKAPQVQSMAQDIVDARAAGLFSSNIASNRYPAGQQDLALGVASMNLNGTWLPGEVAESAGPDFQWGSFSPPLSTNGAGVAGETMMGAQGYAIAKGSAHPDETFALIAHLMSKAAQERVVAETGQTTSRLDVAWPATLTAARDLVVSAKTAVGWACDIANAGEVVPNVVLPGYQELLNGQLDAKGYVDAMAQRSASFWSSR